MSIYVGNLSYQTSDTNLSELFSQFGGVKSVKMVTDRETGQSKGFAFVDMDSEDQAQTAISQLDGKEFMGRKLRVNVSRPREERPSRGGRY